MSSDTRRFAWPPSPNAVVAAAAVLCVATGVVVVAHALAWEPVHAALPGSATMKANTAIALILAGVALWCRRAGTGAPFARRLASASALAVVALALATLLQYALGADLGIDGLFAPERRHVDDVVPGRMSVVTAVNLALAGTALLLADVRTRRGGQPSDWLALAIAANSFAVLLGYVYNLQSLYRPVVGNPVPAQTALMLLVLAAGIAFSRADSTFVRRVTADDSGGRIVRRLLLAAIVPPPLLGFLRRLGEDAGWYSPASGLALYAMSNVVVFAALVWFNVRSVQRIADRESSTARTSAWQQAILNSADFTVISTGTDGEIRTINSAALAKLGYAADELVGRATLAALHDPVEVAARARALSLRYGERIGPGFAALVAEASRGGAGEHDWTYRRRDGTGFPVRLSITALTDADGRLGGYLAIGKDLTAQRDAERSARESDRRLRLIVDNVPELIAYVDRDLRFRFNNLAYADWLVQPLDAVEGRRVDESYAPGVYDLFRPYLERALAGERLTFEVAVPRAGELRHLRGTYVPDVDRNGTVAGIYGLVSDITDLKLAEAQLRKLAQFDALTGLANRRTYAERVHEAIRRCEVTGGVMALVFLDVDHFKAINDRYGHAAGDRVLQTVAERLSQCVRADDTVARLAGDEFVVVLQALCVPDDARGIADTILERLRGTVDVGGAHIGISASLGIALRRGGEFDAAQLLRRADEALYRAKQEGRGRFYIAI